MEPSVPIQKKHWNHRLLNREPLEPSAPGQNNIRTTHLQIGNHWKLNFLKENHWNNPFLNRKPLEPSVPILEKI